MSTPGAHPLVHIIDSDTRGAGWECIPAVVEWLQHATEDERLEAYPLVCTRIPAREPWYHRGLGFALAGTAPRVREMVRALSELGTPHASETATVIALRPRAWLPDLVDRWLLTSPASARATLDVLVERGVIARPTDGAYVTAMLYGSGGNSHDAATIRGLLLTEPSTAGTDVLTLLRAPGIGRTLYLLDSGWGGFRIHEGTWIRQIALLVDEGVVDRAAVLDACLRELGRPAEREPAIWFTGMCQHLKPAAADIEPFAAQLIGLLHAERSATVALAQAGLLLLVRAERLDPRALLQASAAPIGRDEKGIVLAQLRMLDLVATKHSEFRAQVVQTARVALQHARTDVQDAALKLIRRHGTMAALSDDDRVALSPALASAAGFTSDPSAPDERVDQCAARVASLPVAVRERWTLDVAVADARTGQFPALPPPPSTMGEPVVPVTDDPVEFAALLGELCEREADPVQWQQALAAAVRTATISGSNARRRLGPARQRAAAVTPVQQLHAPPAGTRAVARRGVGRGAAGRVGAKRTRGQAGRRRFPDGRRLRWPYPRPPGNRPSFRTDAHHLGDRPRDPADSPARHPSRASRARRGACGAAASARSRRGVLAGRSKARPGNSGTPSPALPPAGAPRTCRIDRRWH